MYFLAAFVGIFVGNVLFGEDIFRSEVMADWGRQDVLRLHKLLQIISQLGVFVIPSILFTYWASAKKSDYLPLVKPHQSIWIWIPIFFVGLTFLNSLLYELNRSIDFSFISEEFQYNLVYNQALSDKKISTFIGDTWLSFGGNLLVICLIPAVSEELIFRGVLQRLGIELTRNAHKGVFFSAILFGLMHWQPLNLLPIFALGLAYGYLTLLTGSLLVPMILHFLNNTFRLVIMHVDRKYSIDFIHIEWYWSFAIVLLTILLVIKKGKIRLLNQVVQKENENHAG
jgi:membrane protease YdiL (CAAX protease family)